MDDEGHDDKLPPNPDPERSRDRGTRPAWGENVSERRRRLAVSLVQDRVAEVASVIGRTVPAAGLLTGAATCAEVRLNDADTVHRFIRIGFITTESAIAGVQTALKREGWHTTVPGTDSGIISIAHAQGRRPHFVVLDGDRDRLDGPGAPHPASPEGRARRERRLRAAMIPPSLVLGVRRRLERDVGVDIETLEVQVRLSGP
ncbi:MAG: hypothetical protein GY895_02755 [Phycisphaera sp.]|nr:hypothetical protein [Phycisphaera sp.]